MHTTFCNALLRTTSRVGALQHADKVASARTAASIRSCKCTRARIHTIAFGCERLRHSSGARRHASSFIHFVRITNTHTHTHTAATRTQQTRNATGVRHCRLFLACNSTFIHANERPPMMMMTMLMIAADDDDDDCVLHTLEPLTLGHLNVLRHQFMGRAPPNTPGDLPQVYFDSLI